MAESADVLTGPHQRVVLPDLNAGCSMADMADADQVEECWEALAGVIDVDRVDPITYINSSAALKAFVGRHGGACCTSSNARAVLTWALANEATGCCSSPTSTWAATPPSTSATRADDMRVWNPRLEQGGLDDREIKDARFLLWKGHCSVHQRFTPAHVAAARAEHPGVGSRPPRVPPRGRGAGRPGRLHRAHPRLGRAGPGRARSWPSAPRSTWSGAWPPSTPTRRSSPSTP